MGRGKRRTPAERKALLAEYKAVPDGKKVAWIRKKGLSTATIYRYRLQAGLVKKKVKK